MPSSRHAALMRMIQSLRNSPLRARRSRKAYWPECRTCSFAARRWRLREPEYPSARSRIARRCFLLWTARFTRAMDRTPSSGRRRPGGRLRVGRGGPGQRRPSMRSTCYLSPPVTSAPRARRRVRLVGSCSRRWARKALRRRIFPDPVTLNRFAAPRCVFTFGISGSSCLGRGGVRHRCRGCGGGCRRGCGCGGPLVLLRGLRLLRGVQHHRHVAPVLTRCRLDHRDLVHVGGELIEDLAPELRVGHLAAAEHDRDLDLVSLTEELHDLLRLRRVVVDVDLRAVLHLLDDDVRRLLARLLAPLLLLVLPPPVIHDPAHRRSLVLARADLDKIQLGLAHDGEGLGQWFDSELRPVLTDQQHLACADAVVDPGFVYSSDVGITSPIRDP